MTATDQTSETVLTEEMLRAKLQFAGPEAYEAYNKRLDEANGELIWEFEGDSYYVHDHGRSFVCAPWSYHEHFALLKAFDPADYVVR